ncbi:MAG: hypothetical protein HQL95_00405 [Magnetococcales bacterium]|nr:hypothetical protein [Magnetococcales bacterium]
MFRVLLILAVIGGVIYFLLRKKQVRVNLTPTGRNVLMMAIERLFQLLLRRIGL